MPSAVAAFIRFANLFSEPILLVSPDARLLDANSHARLTLLGGGPPPHSLRDLVEDVSEQLLDYLRLCSRTPQPLPGRLTVRAPHSEAARTQQYRCVGCAFPPEPQDQERLVMLRLAPRTASNQFLALNQQIERLKAEITGRRQAEQAALDQRELLRVTLASIGDAVITTDLAGSVTFMNAVAESLTGWRVMDATGQPLTHVLLIRNESSGEALDSPVHRILSTGSMAAVANHSVLVRKDGDEFPIDVSGARIRDASGGVLGIVLVFRDVSERRRLEHELIRQREALREADRLKDEFLAMLAHELRNPLAPLRYCVEILSTQRRGAVDIEPLVGIMERQTNQLVRLVDDLIDVSRITRGTIVLKREHVGLRAAVEQAVDTIKPAIEARRQRLRLEIPPQDLLVDADPVRLAQIISNILGNAVKFTPPGGEIVLKVRQEEHQALVSVRDTGIGLHPTSLPHIFEMFRQEDKSLQRSQGGLGIGLAVVRRLLRLHGTDITAHSEGPGRGSEFRFWLSLAAPVVGMAVDAASPAEARSAARVLIVDDNKDGAESLAMVLRLSGYEVSIAYDGYQGLELVQSFAPSTILLDIGLPDMNGYDVARQIRLQKERSAVKLIAMTGYGSEVDRARSKEAGFDAHLTKPVALVTLQELLA